MEEAVIMAVALYSAWRRGAVGGERSGSRALSASSPADLASLSLSGFPFAHSSGTSTCPAHQKELCPPNSYFELLTPVPQTVSGLGDGAFKERIKLK